MEFLKRWWGGTTEIQHFDDLNDHDSGVFVYPAVTVRHHWTAKAARAVVGFCRVHWAFVIGTLLTLIGIWIGVLSLK